MHVVRAYFFFYQFCHNPGFIFTVYDIFLLSSKKKAHEKSLPIRIDNGSLYYPLFYLLSWPYDVCFCTFQYHGVVLITAVHAPYGNRWVSAPPTPPIC